MKSTNYYAFYAGDDDDQPLDCPGIATMKQKHFGNIAPPPMPTLGDDNVAKPVADGIIEAVNLDDFYWTPEEKEHRAWLLLLAITNLIPPSQLGWRLRKARENCWPIGVCEHIEHIAPQMCADALAAAQQAWRERWQHA